MEGPSAVLNVMTLPPGATKTQARLVIDGVRGAIFEYKTGGPAGALVGSWAMTAGTDPYGNAYPQGLSVSSGSIIEALVTFAGIVYAVSLSAPVNTFPGLSIAGTGANAPNSGGGVGGQVDNSHAHIELYTGTLSPSDVPALWDMRSQLDSGTANGQANLKAGLIVLGALSTFQVDDNNKRAEVLGTLLLQNQGSTPAAVSGWAEGFSDSNSVARYVNGADGNAYALGKLTSDVTATITINSLADIVIASVQVAANVKYRFRGMVVYLENQAAGAPVIGFDGSAVLSEVVGRSWYDNGGGGQAGVNTQIYNGSFNINTGPTMVGGTRAYEAEGFIIFSGAGSFNLRGHCTVAADTWQVAKGSYFEIEPV